MQTNPNTNPSMTEAQGREEICRVGKSLYDRGYVHASAGNISVRLDDGYLITPTDACLGTLVPQQLAKLDLNGQQLSGDTASKTLALHLRIYAAALPFDPHMRCVIHTHSTHCVALSMAQGASAAGAELLPPLTPYFVMKVGHVPHIAYQRPGALHTGDAVAQAITHYGAQGRPIRAVMLERLGPNVWHASPAQALAVLEELEETAKLMTLCRPTPLPLNQEQIHELRQTFGARW